MSQAKDEEITADYDLHAYIDHQLAPADEAEIVARIAVDPEERDRVQAYAVQKQLLREAAEALDPHVVNLKTAALERELARRLDRQSWSLPQWARQAAAAAIFVGAGWFGHLYYAKVAEPLPGYVAEAAGAHAVFAEDRIHPVEFPVATVDQARSWLASKIGRTVAVPTLDPLGIKLVGARPLGTKEGALVQFIYEDQFGHRMSLVVAPHPEGSPAHGMVLANARQGNVGYWSDGSLDYALVAKTSDAQLRAIADEISKALPPRQLSLLSQGT